MAILMPGGPVGKALSEKTAQNAARLKEMGVTATLEVIRVGQRPEDMAYERAAMKRAQAVGVQVRQTLLPADARPEELVAALQRVNEDDWVRDLSIRQALQRLQQRERRIIRRRFFQGKTQMEVAEEIGISQAQVSRLEKAALQQMKKYM